MALRLPHRADADRETDIPQLRLDEVSQVGHKIKSVITAGANWESFRFRFFRFSLFGFFFMGPTIYCWIRLAGVMWPRTDIKSSLCKAITEQTAYDPMAISSFLFFMTLMEGNSYAQARQEVR